MADILFKFLSNSSCENLFARQAGFILLLITLPFCSTRAQLVITSPLNNQVQQRDISGNAFVAITAYSYFPYSRIEARLMPLDGDSNKSLDWVFDQEQISQGFLKTSIQAATGWYKLTITGYSGDQIIDLATINRVGVGEVFLVAGNSNAMGIPGLGSKDASDQVIAFNANNKFLNRDNITIASDEPMQAPEFNPVKAKNLIYPSGEASWYWAELGDMLSKKINSPILFLNAGWAAANSENYRDAASGKDAFNLYVGKNWPNRQPYTNLINTMRYFNSWLGARAVLWSHGENDSQLGFSEENYFNNIKSLIENSRRDSGFEIPWFIARNSISYSFDNPYQPVINAQTRLSVLKNLNTFPGPNLDTIQVPRSAHGHFENVKDGTQGLSLAARAWNRILTDSTFRKTIPLQPKYVIHTGIVPSALKPGASFLITFTTSEPHKEPASFQVELLNEEGNFIDTLGFGNESPLRLSLPVTLKKGLYKLRITAWRPTVAGSISSLFYVDKTLPENDFIHHITARPAGQQIHISWLMAANPELERMILQKTTNGETYSDLQTMEAENNRNNSHLYSYADVNSGESSTFYRVQSEFKDGTKSYSQIATVFQEGAPPRFIVFPNPVLRQRFYLRSDENEPILKCSLFDVLGREHPLLTNEREVIGVITARTLHDLPGGNYFLRIISKSGTSTQTLLFH